VRALVQKGSARKENGKRKRTTEPKRKTLSESTTIRRLGGFGREWNADKQACSAGRAEECWLKGRGVTDAAGTKTKSPERAGAGGSRNSKRRAIRKKELTGWKERQFSQVKSEKYKKRALGEGKPRELFWESWLRKKA